MVNSVTVLNFILKKVPVICHRVTTEIVILAAYYTSAVLRRVIVLPFCITGVIYLSAIFTSLLAVLRLHFFSIGHIAVNDHRFAGK